MRFFARSSMSGVRTLITVAAIISSFAVTGALRTQVAFAHTTGAASAKAHIDCTRANALCTEVLDSERVFGEGKYIGHDEPSALFYSNAPGSGNRMRYTLTLPKDPAPAPLSAGKAFNFQLHIAFWLGMAMCDTQSYPEQLSTCTRNSDSNIVDPAVSLKHAGTAFMEMQFYPPGWAPQPLSTSCDAKKWCAALNVDSLSFNPLTGEFNNPTCVNGAGLEYVNFAFITKNGIPHAPANPLQSTFATLTPDPTRDLFMNSGDNIVVTMHDTPHGLRIALDDKTTGESGSMTTSAENSFGQVKFDPKGKACQNIPYDFHPMYSTSSEKTRVPWAAHSYNISFADEIGHFDYCNHVNATGACTGKEGAPGDAEPADEDDAACAPAFASLLVPVSGCVGTNTGFDGISYQRAWPDGNTRLHPTSILFTSPLTGSGYKVNYNRMGFEADLPAIEFPVCNRMTGDHCTLIPVNDDGKPANFYPFFSTGASARGCVWRIGNDMPGQITDFGRNSQFGNLLKLAYTGPGGTPMSLFNNFRQVLSYNPCKTG